MANGATGKIVALAVSLDDLPGHQNEHVVGTERVFLEVDAGAGLSAETQGEHGQIDPARIFENRNSAEVVEHGQIVAIVSMFSRASGLIVVRSRRGMLCSFMAMTLSSGQT